VLNQMLEWRKYLRDNQMKQLVRRAIDTNRTHLGAATNEQWQQWLEREFTPEIE
jgi:hypothetical protein